MHELHMFTLILPSLSMVAHAWPLSSSFCCLVFSADATTHMMSELPGGVLLPSSSAGEESCCGFASESS